MEETESRNILATLLRRADQGAASDRKLIVLIKHYSPRMMRAERVLGSFAALRFHLGLDECEQIGHQEHMMIWTVLY